MQDTLREAHLALLLDEFLDSRAQSGRGSIRGPNIVNRINLEEICKLLSPFNVLSFGHG